MVAFTFTLTLIS